MGKFRRTVMLNEKPCANYLYTRKGRIRNLSARLGRGMIPNMAANVPLLATQNIVFGSMDDAVAVAVTSTNVCIVPSPGDHSNGSSKALVTNVVVSPWEDKFYEGQIVAVHMTGSYFAYVQMIGTTSQSSVRIVNRSTSAKTIIQGFTGTVGDIGFSYMSNRCVLASLDSEGTLMVHTIVESGQEIYCRLMLTIVPGCGEPIDPKDPKRVFWCPCIPDGADDDEDGWLLAITRGSKIEVWNVYAVASIHGPGPVSSKTVTSGFFTIESASTVISNAAFSPDGFYIATASLNGFCEFYQVHTDSHELCNPPQLLHQLVPHDGEPVDTLFFLDDLFSLSDDDQVWKYAVTGAKGNREIKIWSCISWECLQRISLVSRSSPHDSAKLKAAVDLTAGYILLSDDYLRIFYVLALQRDVKNRIQPFVHTIAGFRMPCSILNFSIIDAGAPDEQTELMVKELRRVGVFEPRGAVVLQLYIVQPKSLQKCKLVFQSSNATEVHEDMLHNVSVPASDIDRKETSEKTYPPPTLMSPVAVRSPSSGVQVAASRTPPVPAMLESRPHETAHFDSELDTAGGVCTRDGSSSLKISGKRLYKAISALERCLGEMVLNESISEDLQAEMMQLIDQGQVDKAFQQLQSYIADPNGPLAKRAERLQIV